jgi:hypothetical protein
LNNYFTKNNAIYGPNYGSYPSNLKIIDKTAWTKEFVSGKDFNTTI